MTEIRPNTRQRILEAAGEIFAESGLRQTTIRQISNRAGVNVAAINYHFQSKDNLYLETLRYWKDVAFGKYPRELGTSQTDEPEKRLRGFIRSFVFRILDGGIESRFGKLMAREFAEPTAALDMIVEEAARPMFHLISAITARITGRDPASDTVLYCCASIVGQCLYFLYARPVLRRLVGDDRVNSMSMVDIADHITRFSIAALLEIREDREGASS
ncbi:MAG: CerR family C-terminal domain-containing protein [Syntrophorhabdaceae bacterium]|nr:CerR family C-terminal domain-containing protein [Syntrophorhabdaceae bacterium]